jgi:hypothetical protein
VADWRSRGAGRVAVPDESVPGAVGMAWPGKQLIRIDVVDSKFIADSK